MKFKLSKNLKNIYREKNARRNSKKREEKYPDYFTVDHHPFEFGFDSMQICFEIERAELYTGFPTGPRNAELRFP